MDCGPPSSSVYGIPGKNTGVGSHSLLQGIFLTQGSNPRLLHDRQILYLLSHREALEKERGPLESRALAIGWGHGGNGWSPVLCVGLP